MGDSIKRRRKSKGRWMKLRDASLLATYMKARDFSGARLGRYAGCSRQFIHQLVHGEKNTCTREVGLRIEEALSVLPGTLFVPQESHGVRPAVRRDREKVPA
jgi:plasmid maintenance system antidote protein VapI